jgi:hypothetical protein
LKRILAMTNITQTTIASTKAALSILDDAVKMSPESFRARLEQFLKRRGFPLNVSLR